MSFNFNSIAEEYGKFRFGNSLVANDLLRMLNGVNNDFVLGSRMWYMQLRLFISKENYK